jgi:SOS-response transcriptional repressor LexA
MTPCARPLTPRQYEVLGWIRDFIGSSDISPTMQEVADSFGLSKVTIYGTMVALELKGWITRDKHKARSIRIVGGVCPTCGRGA